METDDPRIAQAIDAAREARERAHVPYSRFRMGAAIVTDRGEIVPGALVENVSLGLAMCAERAAFFGAVSAAAGKAELLVLSAPRTDGALTWPCGACLQVACELTNPDLLIVVTDGEETETARLADLAPRMPIKKTPVR